MREGIHIKPASARGFGNEDDGLGAAWRMDLPADFYNNTSSAVRIIDVDGVQVLQLVAANNAAGINLATPPGGGATAFIDMSAWDNSLGDI